MRKTLLPCALLLAITGCDNSTTMETPKDIELTAPAAGQGFQLAVPAYEVPAGHEVQGCYFFKAPDLNNGQPYFVNMIELAQNPGSHHMNIFRQNTIVAPDPNDPSVGLKGPNADGTGSVISMDGKGACFK